MFQHPAVHAQLREQLQQPCAFQSCMSVHTLAVLNAQAASAAQDQCASTTRATACHVSSRQGDARQSPVYELAADTWANNCFPLPGLQMEAEHMNTLDGWHRTQPTSTWRIETLHKCRPCLRHQHCSKQYTSVGADWQRHERSKPAPVLSQPCMLKTTLGPDSRQLDVQPQALQRAAQRKHSLLGGGTNISACPLLCDQ